MYNKALRTTAEGNTREPGDRETNTGAHEGKVSVEKGHVDNSELLVDDDSGTDAMSAANKPEGENVIQRQKRHQQRIQNIFFAIENQLNFWCGLTLIFYVDNINAISGFLHVWLRLVSDWLFHTRLCRHPKFAVGVTSEGILEIEIKLDFHICLQIYKSRQDLHLP